MAPRQSPESSSGKSIHHHEGGSYGSEDIGSQRHRNGISNSIDQNFSRKRTIMEAALAEHSSTRTSNEEVLLQRKNALRYIP